VSLEDAFWNGLKEIARERHMTLSELVAEIDAQRQLGNLSSALRLFVLEFYRTQLAHGKEGRDGTHEMIGYILAVKNPSNGRHRARLAAQHGLEAFFHQTWMGWFPELR
jgi:predicted DNA-binding ribbon-helix-helix protein